MRTYYSAANIAVHAVTITLIVASITVHPVLTITSGALYLWPVLSDWAASKRSTHVVYMLRDIDHNVIYVGETDDATRRMYEHTDGTEHTWWADIYGYTVWRNCWSDRQAKRIERRLIGVVNHAAAKSWCASLRNEMFGEDHQKAHRALPIRAWYLPYLAASLAYDSRSFHGPCIASICIPHRPEDPEPDPYADTFDDWVDNEPTAGEPHEATYERRANTSNPATLLALPPAVCHASQRDRDSHTAPPSRREGERRTSTSHRDRDNQPASEPGESIRDAHQRQQAATVGTFPADLAAHLTADEADALPGMDPDAIKKLRATLRQRKSRANRPAAAGHSPTMTARTRRAGGGGVGEGDQ